MKRPSIKLALVGIFTSILLTAGLMANAGNAGVSTTNGATEEIAANWLPSVEVVNAINTATSDFHIAEGAHIMSTTEEEMARVEADQ